MRPHGLPILTYHDIDANGAVTSTDPAWFAETLHALHESGYRCVDLQEWILAGRPPVDRGYALTFDDGYRSILEIADVLVRYQATATVFLVSDRVGQDNDWPGQPAWVPRAALLDWSEIEGLHPLGFGFAAHGRTHCRLDRCDDVTLIEEIQGSRLALEDRLGRACPLFAYPYGISTPRVRDAVVPHFDGAFGTRLDLADAQQCVHELSRVDAYYLRSERALSRLIHGRLQAWLSMRRALREIRRLSSDAIACFSRDRSSFRSEPTFTSAPGESPQQNSEAGQHHVRPRQASAALHL